MFWSSDKFHNRSEISGLRCFADVLHVGFIRNSIIRNDYEAGHKIRQLKYFSQEQLGNFTISNCLKKEYIDLLLYVNLYDFSLEKIVTLICLDILSDDKRLYPPRSV